MICFFYSTNLEKISNLVINSYKESYANKLFPDYFSYYIHILIRLISSKFIEERSSTIFKAENKIFNKLVLNSKYDYSED